MAAHVAKVDQADHGERPRWWWDTHNAPNAPLDDGALCRLARGPKDTAQVGQEWSECAAEAPSRWSMSDWAAQVSHGQNDCAGDMRDIPGWLGRAGRHWEGGRRADGAAVGIQVAAHQAQPGIESEATRCQLRQAVDRMEGAGKDGAEDMWRKAARASRRAEEGEEVVADLEAGGREDRKEEAEEEEDGRMAEV